MYITDPDIVSEPRNAYPSHKQLKLWAKTTYHWMSKLLLPGGLITLGFAPFHLPGLLLLSLAWFFTQLSDQKTQTQPFLAGYIYGIGYFGCGISWVYVSMQQFGHLHPILAFGCTALFVLYLACFPALTSWLYCKLRQPLHKLLACALFAALWGLSEYLRAVCLGGFPWLLVGVSQIDTPLHYLFPLIGVYGVSVITVFAAAMLSSSFASKQHKYLGSALFVIIILTPKLLQHHTWTTVDRQHPHSVAIVQANLSMRDKWDETIFWDLLTYYQQKIQQLIGVAELIVLPESAIPVPGHYISDILDDLATHAKQHNSAILLGIPYPTSADETYYYNTMTSLGYAQGSYYKQQLVPFGEYIPPRFSTLSKWLAVPMNNLKPGSARQAPITIHGQPIASLICYELAYPELLRQQMPAAQWIVSISDDGWFGHSLAIYQHLQMSQVLSSLTGRYQVVANNDGLSAIINDTGDIVDALPAFQAGQLNNQLYAASGHTPWSYLGDKPVLLVCLLCLAIAGLLTLRNNGVTLKR